MSGRSSPGYPGLLVGTVITHLVLIELGKQRRLAGAR